MLKNLLNKNRQFNPTYSKERLTNHLSMALIALDKMGASEEQLKLFYDNYSLNLELLTNSSPEIIINSENWMTFLGQNNSYNAYTLFFSENINILGITKALETYVLILMKGVATDAFHCLIRLAYAIDIDDSDEIAYSLAYFASRCTFLPQATSCEPISDNPEKLLMKIRSIENLKERKFQDETLIDRFLKVTAIPEFSSISNWLVITENTLEDCATTAIRLYASTKNFTALHLVTATHAMRLILPFIPNPLEALRYYWQAFCAAYISIGAPPITWIDLSEFVYRPWKDIFFEIVKKKDDHGIKMVYSCYMEDQIYKNPLYNYVASNILK